MENKSQGISVSLQKQKIKPNIKHYITTKLTGRCLDISQDSDHGNQKGDLIVYDYYGGPNQEFYIINQGNDYYIKSAQTQKVLQVYEGSHQNGAKIIQAQYKSKLHQRWFFQELAQGTGQYYIYSSNSGRVLDVYNEVGKNNVKVIQWQFHGGKNQIWKIHQV